MTLVEWMRTLRADQTSGTGPLLIVGEDTLTDAQRADIIGATYARRPYAVVVNRNRAAPRRTHANRAFMTGAVDVNLYHPAAGLVVPNGDMLAKLQAKLLDAQTQVTEVRAAYLLAASFKVASEIDPHPDPDTKLGGLRAVTRFTYAIWR